ncbi:MAG: hypothetical protein D8M57_04605 [Candidatus Scalindua sp. AMX11]|nr:MAG: hypothetical protein D8M57_04605 [Candidatus Scalindua sp. AMX11]
MSRPIRFVTYIQKNSMKVCKLNNENGFTMVELMIAIVIITLGMFAVMSLVVVVIRGNSNSDNMTTATILAQDRMEDAKRLGYAGLPGPIPVVEGYGSMTAHPLYRRVSTITVDDPFVGMTSVNVEVFWDSDNHSVALDTIIAQ